MAKVSLLHLTDHQRVQCLVRTISLSNYDTASENSPVVGEWISDENSPKDVDLSSTVNADVDGVPSNEPTASTGNASRPRPMADSDRSSSGIGVPSFVKSLTTPSFSIRTIAPNSNNNTSSSTTNTTNSSTSSNTRSIKVAVTVAVTVAPPPATILEAASAVGAAPPPLPVAVTATVPPPAATTVPVAATPVAAEVLQIFRRRWTILLRQRTRSEEVPHLPKLALPLRARIPRLVGWREHRVHYR